MKKLLLLFAVITLAGCSKEETSTEARGCWRYVKWLYDVQAGEKIDGIPYVNCGGNGYLGVTFDELINELKKFNGLYVTKLDDDAYVFTEKRDSKIGILIEDIELIPD